jgi:hypothetical protein
MDNKNLELPTQSKGDVAHSVAKAGLAVIPVLGGAAVELFQNVVQPPLEKRRAAWMAQVGEKLQELEEKGLDLNVLQENEQFISAVMYASQLAIRTHNEEKLKAGARRSDATSVFELCRYSIGASYTNIETVSGPSATTQYE